MTSIPTDLLQVAGAAHSTTNGLASALTNDVISAASAAAGAFVPLAASPEELMAQSANDMGFAAAQMGGLVSDPGDDPTVADDANPVVAVAGTLKSVSKYNKKPGKTMAEASVAAAAASTEATDALDGAGSDSSDSGTVPSGAIGNSNNNNTNTNINNTNSSLSSSHGVATTGIKRKSISLSRKKEAIEWISGPGKGIPSRAEKHFSDLNWDVSASSFRKWWKNRDKIMSDSSAKKRIAGGGRKPYLGDNEERLLVAVIAEKAKKDRVTRKWIAKTAQQMFQHSNSSFKASENWVTKFIRRNGLTLRRSYVTFTQPNALLAQSLGAEHPEVVHLATHSTALQATAHGIAAAAAAADNVNSLISDSNAKEHVV